jgi:putative transposase
MDPARPAIPRAARNGRHHGRIAVERPDTRWCSDGFEIGCENDKKVRIAFTLDCCDREANSWVATTDGIDSSDLGDPRLRRRRL